MTWAELRPAFAKRRYPCAERASAHGLIARNNQCTILDQEYGISTDRRTIYTEMEILDKFGLDIQQKKGKNPGYYIGARDFELPE